MKGMKKKLVITRAIVESRFDVITRNCEPMALLSSLSFLSFRFRLLVIQVTYVRHLVPSRLL
jgi:hypothetical protein